jgi:D-alanine-D-alanine ligase
MMTAPAKSFFLSESQRERFGRVAVLYGGTSAEREISLQSGAAVLAALQRVGVNAFGVDTAQIGLRELGDMHLDRAFIALHGPGGEDGTLQGALEMLRIPYTGCGVLASALGMDKLRCKMLWKQQQLPTPPFYPLNGNSDWTEVLDALGGKVIVKPVHEGSSIGMEVAETAEQLQSAFDNAARFDSEVMAEQWITGREFTIALLAGEVLPAIELKTDHRFYDYDAKYLSNSTEYLCPAELSPEALGQMQSIATRAFRTIGGRGWGRVDFMADSDANFYLLEVNTVPGLTSHSLVPMSARAAGYGFEELIIRILEDSFSRDRSFTAEGGASR